jgi:hypothetical protein
MAMAEQAEGFLKGKVACWGFIQNHSSVKDLQLFPFWVHSKLVFPSTFKSVSRHFLQQKYRIPKQNPVYVFKTLKIENKFQNFTDDQNHSAASAENG